MTWQGHAAMGTMSGNGMGGPGGNDMNNAMQGNPGNQPHATEYTLQGMPRLPVRPTTGALLTGFPRTGVMRFLQTEWHRHERDRNAWEIEKQEMKGRIASLEGAARRADATQKTLKKYVAILEKKVKGQAAQLRSTADAAEDAPDPSRPDKSDRAAKIQERLRGECGPGVSPRDAASNATSQRRARCRRPRRRKVRS